MIVCRRCGTAGGAGRFCAGCGAPAGHQGPPSHPPRSSHPTGPDALRLLPAGALALAALLVLVASFTGYFVAAALIPALVETAALVAVAVGVATGKRLGRAGAALVAPLVLLDALAAYSGTALRFLAALLALGAVAALVLVPALRAAFEADRPRTAPSVSLARIVVTALAIGGALYAALFSVLLVVGLAGLSSVAGTYSGGSAGRGLLGALGGMMSGVALAVIIFSGGLSAFGFWARQALAARSELARILVTVVASVMLLITLAAAVWTGFGLVAAGLHAGLLVLLWVPGDALVHFGARPIATVEQLRHQLCPPASPTSHPVPAPRPAPRSSSWPAPHSSSWPAPAHPGVDPLGDDAPTGALDLGHAGAAAPMSPPAGTPVPAPRTGGARHRAPAVVPTVVRDHGARGAGV